MPQGLLQLRRHLADGLVERGDQVVDLGLRDDEGWRQENVVAVDAVGGVSIGGDPLVSSVVLAAYQEKDDLKGFLIRKEPKGHGTNRWVEGGKNLKKGMNVVILEDVVTTGGSSLKAIEAVEKEGYKVKGVIALLDRLDGGQEAIESQGYIFKAIFTLKDIRTSS